MKCYHKLNSANWSGWRDILRFVFYKRKNVPGKRICVPALLTKQQKPKCVPAKLSRNLPTMWHSKNGATTMTLTLVLLGPT